MKFPCSLVSALFLVDRVCCTRKRVLSVPYSRYGTKNGLISFSKNSSPEFVNHKFNNWRKGPEKFKSHESSLSQRAAVIKWNLLGRQSLLEQVTTKQHIRHNMAYSSSCSDKMEFVR